MYGCYNNMRLVSNGKVLDMYVVLLLCYQYELSWTTPFPRVHVHCIYTSNINEKRSVKTRKICIVI